MLLIGAILQFCVLVVLGLIVDLLVQVALQAAVVARLMVVLFNQIQSIFHQRYIVITINKL